MPRDFTTYKGVWCSGLTDSYHNSYCQADYLGNTARPAYNSQTNQPVTQFQVPWGTSSWTYIYWDVYVPTNTYYFSDGHAPTQIIGAIPWFSSADHYNDPVSCWFANAQIYKNP